MKKSMQLNFVVALSAEAQPIIHHYRLKRLHEITAFEVYGNDDIRLIISGIGKQNAAVATGYLAGLNETDLICAWLNVGIAGGQAAKIGEIALANTITDEESGKNYFPTLCFDIKFTQTKIITVNQPNENYKGEHLYDMEAAGFFVAASRFSPSELVHSCKVVSDNKEQGIKNISRESTAELVKNSINDIDRVAQEIFRLGGQLMPNEYIRQVISYLTEKYHFTTTQKNSLQVLLQHWFAINGNIDQELFRADKAKNSSEFLEALKNKIEAQPVFY